MTTPCIPGINHSRLREVSRSDLVLKLLWFSQVSWYLIHCIARGTQHLSIPLLGLSTVGLIMCAIMLQFLWWSKPLDVQCPIPIPITISEYDTLDFRDACFQEQLQSRRGSVRIPVSDFAVKIKLRVNNDTTTSNRAVFALPTVVIIFGAVHLLAWNFYFPTASEQLLWRISALLVVGTRTALAGIERFGYWLGVGAVTLPTRIEHLFI